MRLLPALLLLLAACANPDAPAVQAAPILDTRDALGPYAVSASVIENRTIHEVRVYYRAETAGSAAVSTLEEVDEGRFEGEIPGFPAGTTVHWFVEAEDTDGNVGYAPPESELGDARCLDTLSPGEVPEAGASFCFTVLQ